jgi:hypothetical protein
MQTIELIRAEPGAKKVSCTKALQAHCGLGLAAAKAATDALLERRTPVIIISTEEAARKLILDLAQLGVLARFAEGPNYNPQERLAAALAPLRSMLSAETLQTCEALSAHGEWEMALSHCLAGVPKETRAVAPDAFEALDRLAVEFGIARKHRP